MKTILITGARSGFGRSSAIALAKMGHRVIATTRTIDAAKELNSFAKENNLNIETFKLDVTSKRDREKVLKYDLDVLLNNAGIGESGSLAEIDIDKVRNNYEVNVFGPLELTQLVLKKMLKKDKGTIVFISSLAGRVSIPFLAPYCMTKFSLSSGVEALRYELKEITSNVHVCLVEPGAYRTGFNQDNTNRKYSWMNKNSYFYSIIGKLKEREERRWNFIEARSTKSIVNKIVKSCEAKRPRLRYQAPWWQAWVIRLQRVLGR